MQQFQITELARGKVPGGPLARVRLKFADSFGRGDEVNQLPAVRGDKMAG